jgi:hypothetical protein
MGLINHLAKACFVQGSTDERIKMNVRAKEDTALLSTCIDTAMEQEPAVMLVKKRSFSVPKFNRRQESKSMCMFKGFGRGSRFANLQVIRIGLHTLDVVLKLM